MRHLIFTLTLFTLVTTFACTKKDTVVNDSTGKVVLDVIATPEFCINKIDTDVYQIVGGGGNVLVVVNPDNGELLVIDSKVESSLDSFKEALDNISKEYGKDSYTLNTLIYTHYHGDHIGGKEIARNQGATIYAHMNTLNRMVSAGVDNDLLPNQMVTDYSEIVFNNEPITLAYHGPAHTNSDLVIVFTQRKLIVLEDILFTNRYPYMADLNGMPSNLFSIYDMYSTAEYSDYRFVPGHLPSNDNTDGYFINQQQFIALTDTLHQAYNLVKAHKDSEQPADSFDTAQLDALFPQYNDPTFWVESLYLFDTL